MVLKDGILSIYRLIPAPADGKRLRTIPEFVARRRYGLMSNTAYQSGGYAANTARVRINAAPIDPLCVIWFRDKWHTVSSQWEGPDPDGSGRRVCDIGLTREVGDMLARTWELSRLDDIPAPKEQTERG